MGQRKFNIFKKVYDSVNNKEVEEEVLLDKNKKYKLDRKGNIVEYDDDEIELEKEERKKELELKKSTGTISEIEYETQKKDIENDNSLNRIQTEVSDDELVFTGSKSDIRKGEMSERNISVLQTTKVDVLNLRYDIAFFSPADQPMNETLLTFIAPVELLINVNLSLANGTGVHFEGYVESTYTIDVKHNGTQVGTIINETDGSTTISCPELILAVGDRLSYHSPDVFESELKDVSIVVAANQTVK